MSVYSRNFKITRYYIIRRLPPIIANPQYRFALPEIPAQPILIDLPINKDEVAKISKQPFEAQAKYPLLSEPDLGIPIDLVTYIYQHRLHLSSSYYFLLHHIYSSVVDPSSADRPREGQTLPPEDLELLFNEDELPDLTKKSEKKDVQNIAYAGKGLLADYGSYDYGQKRQEKRQFDLSILPCIVS